MDSRAVNSPQRQLNLLDVVVVGINAVIGSGIFLLPGKLTAMMGPAGLLCTLLAGVGAILVAMCFADAAGRFSETGGAYTYAYSAFGPFLGFQVGWMSCVVRIVSWAALANGFAVSVSYFFPLLTTPLAKNVTVLSLLFLLSLLNYVGVKLAASAAGIVSVLKFLPLMVYVGVGLFFVRAEGFTPFAPMGFESLGEGILLMLFAFVGFEVLCIPAGETRDATRTMPLALLIVMLLVTAVYLLIHGIALGTFDGLAASENPISDSASNFLGSFGGSMIAFAIAASILAVNVASSIISPRCFVALAEKGQLPPIMAAVHVRFGSPSAAIIACGLITAIVATNGSFVQLVAVSVVARMLQYISTAVSVVVFQRRDAGRSRTRFQVPLGPVVPMAVVAICVFLISQSSPDKLIVGAIAFGLGIPVYLLFSPKRGNGDAGGN